MQLVCIASDAEDSDLVYLWECTTGSLSESVNDTANWTAPIETGYFSLQDADQKLKADKEIVLAAVKHQGNALTEADKTLQSDKEIVLAAVNQDPWVLEHTIKKFKADKEVVITAVKKDGGTLKFADKNLKNDKKIVLDLLENNEKQLLLETTSILKREKDAPSLGIY